MRGSKLLHLTEIVVLVIVRSEENEKKMHNMSVLEDVVVVEEEVEVEEAGVDVEEVTMVETYRLH